MLSVPKITNPSQSGVFSLRIKSSKAFPLHEVDTIEDLISKIKKPKRSGERVT